MSSDRKVLVRTPTARSSQEAIQAALDARDFDTFKVELQWGGSGRVFWAALMSGIRQQLASKGIPLASEADLVESEMVLPAKKAKSSAPMVSEGDLAQQSEVPAPKVSRPPRSLAAPLPPLEATVTTPPLAPVVAAVEQPLRNVSSQPTAEASADEPAIVGTDPSAMSISKPGGDAPAPAPAGGASYSESAKKHFMNW